MIACGWVVFIIPILCFPSVKGGDLTPDTMNYSKCMSAAPMPETVS